ncbi:type VI secretion system protein ImpH/VasB [Chitinispirillum alkaliphilum]|nr:type VI secretion system protein ImpH/VasB [Chitinispirillum alkaliphilum]
MSDLIELLKERCMEFDFFQAVTLLEEYFGTEECREKETLHEKFHLRFWADTGITFPSSDIHHIESDSDRAVEFYLSFMGLLGISSPLPHYFTEYGATQRDGSEALVDFLNIFDHRFYTLFYAAWKKYRLLHTTKWSHTSDIYTCLASLAGLDLKDQKAPSLLAYAGLFSGVNHNSYALEEILSDILQGVNVRVEQWVGRWARVESENQLGINLVLGSEAMIGERVYDRSGKIRIIIDLESKDDVGSFLPNSPNVEKITEIVPLFTSEPLEFDIQLNFTPANLIPVILGEDNSALGICSSCGENLNKEEQCAITFEC